MAIVGGGIAGLSAAWTIQRDDADVEVAVIEAGRRTGGKLWADDFGGHAVDRGADAFLARVPDAVDLCRELGLDAELTAPVARSAFVLHDGQLHPFPDGLVLGVPTDLDALRRSGIISPDGIARAERDLVDRAQPLDGDVAVGRYVRQRVGDEVFEALVSPLLSGINAGDADELSLDAGAPQLAAAAHTGGSLIEHLRDQRQRASSNGDAPVFYSLIGGAGRLAEVLTERLEPVIERRCAVTGLTRHDSTYRLAIEGESDRVAAAVIMATPAFVTASLLTPLLPAVASELNDIVYASVAIVTFAFAETQLQQPLDGSGFLVPEREGLLMTACSWGSSKWPHWADPSMAVLRVSVGRAHDTRGQELDDDELVDVVRRELATTMGVIGEPTAVQVTRLSNALPQYRPGHLVRLSAWEEELAETLPGVALAGASTRGLGVPACIASGRHAARQVLDTLGQA